MQATNNLNKNTLTTEAQQLKRSPKANTTLSKEREAPRSPFSPVPPRSDKQKRGAAGLNAVVRTGPRCPGMKTSDELAKRSQLMKSIVKRCQIN